jgi:hypothetical protein
MADGENKAAHDDVRSVPIKTDAARSYDAYRRYGGD